MEDVATQALIEAGIDPAAPLGPGELARRLWGPRCIRLVGPDELRGRRGLARVVEGRWVISILSSLRPVAQTFVVAHECAEILLANEEQTPEIEARCDRLAGALILPLPALCLALERGDSVVQIARDFRAPLAVTRRRVAVASSLALPARSWDLANLRQKVERLRAGALARRALRPVELLA